MTTGAAVRCDASVEKNAGNGLSFVSFIPSGCWRMLLLRKAVHSFCRKVAPNNDDHPTYPS